MPHSKFHSCRVAREMAAWMGAKLEDFRKLTNRDRGFELPKILKPGTDTCHDMRMQHWCNGERGTQDVNCQVERRQHEN